MKKVLLMATVFLSLVAVACSSGKDERNHRERHHKKESCHKRDRCCKDSCVVVDTEVVGVATNGKDTVLFIGEGVDIK